MIFTYDKSGTPQQVKWVKDAIAQCSFPIDKVFGVTVNVVWGSFPGSADTRHPYMVTQVNAGGGFVVYIAPWADDPNNFNNQGLPDPSNDIYEFYKQSFVHELGHVMTYVTFDPGAADTDPRIAEMCGLFWAPSTDPGSGRRQGTMADWDAPGLTWAGEIREAVAEVFKVAFYSGRLIYSNRTNWKLDNAQWTAFLNLLRFEAPNPSNPVQQAVDQFQGGSSDPVLSGTMAWTQPGNGTLQTASGEIGSLLGQLVVPQNPMGGKGVLPAVAMIYLANWGWTVGFADGEVYQPTDMVQHLVLTVTGTNGSASIAISNQDVLVAPTTLDPAGWYLVIWVNADGTWYGGAYRGDVSAPGLGQAEPPDQYVACRLASDGSPMLAWNVYHHLGSGDIGVITGVEFELTNDSSVHTQQPVVLEQFLVEGPGTEIAMPGGDYPFAPQYGEMSFGAAATGLLFVGNAP